MKYFFIPLIAFLLCSGKVAAYSVLTHEAIIDLNWDSVIVPLLKKKYPAATAEEIKQAHAYAYGGAIAPDMGYYPFGNRLFSDLIHYVRNGDFIVALEEGATDVNEYAFALGALAHYNADRFGHSLGVNRAVPLVFPEVGEKYGPVVTYAEDQISHIRTEVGFDVLQVARGNYAPDAYHRFISFEIADSLLKRAFRRNYNLEIDSIFTNFPRSVRTFRWAVKDIFPQLTRSAWKAKRAEIKKQQTSATARNFHYRMRRANFNKEYGNERDHPGFGARAIAGLMFIIPKVGPLKALKVKIPGPAAEKLFIRSFDTVSMHFRQDIKSNRSRLPNIDFDTGNPAAVGEYELADKTYFNLLKAQQKRGFAQMDPTLKAHIVLFYKRKGPDEGAKEAPEDWPEIQQALREMQAVPPSR